MNETWTWLLVIGIYLALQIWILPRMGVST